MAWREGREIWREGPDDTQDTRDMGEWEREAYACAKESALSRADVLKLAGLGLGGMLLAPLANATAGGAAREVELQGSKLIIGRKGASINLDPHKTAYTVDLEIITQMFDSLIYLDARGNVHPGLATAWSFSRNGRALTFRLRRGVTFHDGTAFDANAVKFSADRWVDPKTAAPFASNAGPLAAVEVLDQYTVKFLYRERFAPVLVLLSFGLSGIVSKAGVQKYGDTFGRNPVGTGAYRFVEWTADDTIRLKRNPAHTWATPRLLGANGKPLGRGPVIEDVEFRIIPSDPARVAAFGSRQIDLIAGDLAVPSNQVAGLRRRRGTRIVQNPAIGIYCMVLNAFRPPLRDPRSRLAISHAIDRKKMVALALNGEGRPGTSLVASSYLDHDPSAARYSQYDPERARSLLRAAGQRNGFTFDYMIPPEYAPDSDQRAALLMQQDLAEVGIKMKINRAPGAVYVAEYGKKSEEHPAGAFWSGFQFPDAGTAMKATLQPNGFWAWFRDPALNALLQQQETILNRVKRKAIISKIQHHAGSRAYVLALWEVRYTIVAQEYVRNTRNDWQGPYYFVQEMSRA